jgi:hypothetical protein
MNENSPLEFEAFTMKTDKKRARKDTNRSKICGAAKIDSISDAFSWLSIIFTRFSLLSEIFPVMIRCFCHAHPANQPEVKQFYRGSASFFIGLNEDVQRRRRVMRSQIEEVICEPNDVPFLGLSIKHALLSKIMENRVEVSHLVFETSESFCK